MILVLGLGIRSINLPVPCWQGFSGLSHTFILVTCIGFSHEPTTHLKPGCEDYPFLDLTVEDFEQGLNSILMDSIDTQELDASLDEAGACNIIKIIL